MINLQLQPVSTNERPQRVKHLRYINTTFAILNSVYTFNSGPKLSKRYTVSWLTMGISQNLICIIVLVCCFTTHAHNQHDPPAPVPSDALSEHQHFSDSGEHDTSYDHDMFLGRDEARNFENLDPKIVKNKLR